MLRLAVLHEITVFKFELAQPGAPAWSPRDKS